MTWLRRIRARLVIEFASRLPWTARRSAAVDRALLVIEEAHP